jgi:GDP-L-fucose synthase
MAMERIHSANKNKLKFVTFGGTGSSIRDWLYVDDLAEACLFLMQNYDSPEIINIGTGMGTSKKEVAYIIKDIEKFEGKIIFESNFPDGMRKRVLDITKINSLGWKAKTSLEEGLKKTYEWFLNQKR